MPHPFQNLPIGFPFAAKLTCPAPTGLVTLAWDEGNSGWLSMSASQGIVEGFDSEPTGRWVFNDDNAAVSFDVGPVGQSPFDFSWPAGYTVGAQDFPGSRLSDLADQVRAALASAELSLPFTPERHYDPNSKVDEDLGESLRVLVAAAEEDRTLESRAANRENLAVDVGIVKKLPAPVDGQSNRVPDRLMLLAQDIGQFMFRRKIASQALGLNLTCHAFTTSPIYDPEQLEADLVFVTVLRLHFREVRG